MSNANQELNDVDRRGVSGRRRFVRGVGIAIPVALTAQARSALACTCSTVSAHASVALANSHNAKGDFNSTVDCAGISPSSWALNSNSYTGKTTKFGTIFTTTNSTLSNTQMKDAVSNSDEFVRVVAAAYLNLVNNKVIGYYDLLKLQNMWKGRVSGFAPLPESPESLWYESQIKVYLSDTWT